MEVNDKVLRSKLKQVTNLKDFMSLLGAKCKLIKIFVVVFKYLLFNFKVEPIKLDFKPSSFPAGTPGASLKSTEVSEGKCEPKLECIPNPLSKELSIHSDNQYALPTCINVHRCGGFGCCREGAVCAAISQETIIFHNVFKIYLQNHK